MKSKYILLDHWRHLLLIASPLLAAIALALSLTLPALAAPVVNEDIPVSRTVFNPCNGEAVTISGTEHLVIHETVDNNGGFHLDTHANIHLTGSGNLGNNYVGNQEDHFELNVTIGLEAPFTQSIGEVSTGSAPNFLMHFTAHITVNANGDETTFVDHFTSECRG